MKMRLILTTILLTTATIGFAQQEQISGSVINRTTNSPIGGAEVFVSNNVDEHLIRTNELGQFTTPNLYPGLWRIRIIADDFSSHEMSLTLHANTPVNLGNIFMFPLAGGSSLMEMSGLESESDHVQSGPTLLSSQRDVFSNIANFRFSEMRFRARGYDWNLQRVHLNGLPMNDINTGNSPYSLWGGLNDAMRNQEVSVGMQPTHFSNGNIAGTTNVVTRASQIRRGYQLNYASSGGTYAHRFGVTYANQVADGLHLAVSASARCTPADYILSWDKGAYAQGFSYLLGLEKQFSQRESLAFTMFGANIYRGVSGGAVQEIYDILEDPFYSPNWGYQNGKIRNARVRNSHEPIMMLDYNNRINSRLRIQATTSFRFGNNGYTALDWYDAPDPRPDYYRYLPSFFRDPHKEAMVRRSWRNDPNVRHINWEELYHVNRNNEVRLHDVTIMGFNGHPIKGQTIRGLRSKYVIQNRRADQRDFNSAFNVNSLLTNNVRLNGGVNYRWNRTEYFNEMYDLLGGDFWVDIDQFAERDFPNSDEIQNDINRPNRIVHKGDKYGHHYFSFTQRGRAWGVIDYTTGMLNVFAGGDIGFTSFHREGLVTKGLFEDNSFGKSAVHTFLTYAAQAGANYQITGSHIVSANANYMQRAPYFQDAFLSPRTRNSTVDDLVPEKIFSTDLTYTMRLPNAKLHVAGFYTQITDRSRVMMFYDDFHRTMSNFAMSGVSQRHFGAEFGADVHVWNGVSVKSAVAYGDYRYTSDPLLTQTVDNSDEILLRNRAVRWNGHYVAGTPQLASNLGIEYRAPQNWWAGLDLNYYDFIYIDMNPLRRTDEVINSAASRTQMRRQERFDGGFTLNANFGRWKTYNRKYNLGIMLTISNILGNPFFQDLLGTQPMRTGGFEQSRLNRERDDDGRVIDQYTPFPSRYFNMNGTSYFLNVFLRF